MMASLMSDLVSYGMSSILSFSLGRETPFQLGAQAATSLLGSPVGDCLS